MRYRLLASYQGAPYEAGVGPDESGVVLFAACPPPEELRFEPATGHWRKEVSRADVQMLYESRPVGVFRGERCVVLDELTDRLHITYLGHDAHLAERLGYWEVDRGVFELITPRQEVTDIVEQRLPLEVRPDGTRPTFEAGGQAIGHGQELANGTAAHRSSGAPAAPGPDPVAATAAGTSDVSMPTVDEPPLPLEAEAMRAASAAARRGKMDRPKHVAPDPASAARPAARPDRPEPPQEPARAAVPVTPAGISEPSTSVQHGTDVASAVPSWTPQAHIPPQRPSQAQPQHAAPTPDQPAGAPQQRAQIPQPAGVSTGAGTGLMTDAPSAPTERPLQAPVATVTDSAPIHGVPLPPPSELLRQPAAPLAPPASPPADDGPGPGIAPVAELSRPHGGSADPEQHGPVNGVMRDGQVTAAGALLGPAPVGGYVPDQLELPLPASAPGNAAVAPVASESPGASMRLPGSQHPQEPIMALASPPQATQEPLAPAGPHSPYLRLVEPAGPPEHPATVQEPAPADSVPAGETAAQPAQRRRRAAKRRLPTQRIFSDLAAQAAIPANAYAIGEDIDGAMCLIRTDEGFEVFNSMAGARHEVRVFQDEESAYFYLFGVLVAEAVRTGMLAPRQ